MAEEEPARRFEHFKLDPTNRSVPNVDIAEVVTDAQLLLSVEQGSTVTLKVFDKDLKLLRGDFLTGWTWGKNADDIDEDHWIKDGRDIDGTVGGHRFRLVNVTKTGRSLELVFEDVVSVLLKSHRGTRRAVRGNGPGEVTRAEFVKQLCDAAGVTLYAPELHRTQPIQKASQRRPASERREDAKRGLDPSADLGLNPAQRRRVERCMDVADSLNAGQRPTLAMLVAGFGESDWGENRGARGTTFQTTKISEAQLEKQAYHFLKGGNSFLAGGAIGLVRAHPQMSVGEVASKVEISDKGGSHYSPFTDRALRIYAAYHGSTGDTALSTSFNVTQPYVFERGRNETSWDCIQRLAEEVGWVAFARSGRLWFISEDDLFAQKPQIATELTIVGDDGHQENPVDDIDFEIDLDARNPVSEITTTFHGDAWTALPGMVQTVKGTGTADGRWLIVELENNLMSDAQARTARGRKPVAERPEPAPEVNQETIDGADISAGGKVSAGSLSGMSPKDIIDKYVIPVANKFGVSQTAASVTAANHAHTHLGAASDHAGPPGTKWADDIGIGPDVRHGNKAGAEKGDQIAKTLAGMFGIPNGGKGLQSNTIGGFRFQLIWRYEDAQAGNHYTHVHAGVRRA